MLIVLRIFFGALMYLAYKEARMNASINPMYGDISNAYWVAVVVILCIVNAIVWAPYIGEKVADPLTGGAVESEFIEAPNVLLKFVRWCEGKGLRRTACFLCFIEGVRAPFRPVPFVIGMNNARPGSVLERIFAYEVFKFNNAQNCLKAFKILKGHGVDPRPHAMPGINLLMYSSEREVRETPPTVVAPEAPEPPKLERNPRIKIGL